MPCINYLRLCSKIVTTEPTTTTTISPPPAPQPVSFGFCCPPSVCAGCAGLWTSRVVITHIIFLSLSLVFVLARARLSSLAVIMERRLWVLLRFFPLPTPPNLRRRIIEVKTTRRRTNKCVLQLRSVVFFDYLIFFFCSTPNGPHRSDPIVSRFGIVGYPSFFPSF